MNVTSERIYPTPYANSAILPLLLLSLSSQRISPKTTRNIDTEYDYIIVGGGTAGSVVASRLSELPCINVLLLEAGKDPPLLTEVPALAQFFRFTDVDWNYKTVPQSHTGEALKNKQIPLSSGKVLGGSSVLNSMVTLRGSPVDYDNWASKGADGWSYEDVLPYMRKLEDNKDPEYIKNGFHNTGGLVTIQRPRYQSEFKKPVFQAARSIGYKVIDPNALKQTGFYDFQATLRNGQRCSVSKAYLLPAENRTNLHILTKAMVRKVIMKDGRASGVLYDFEGQTIKIHARKEIILSAGAINSAQLLMLSGIGPKKELEKFEIPLVADLPVGHNFQDHCAVPLHFTVNSSIPSTLMKLVNPSNVDQYIKTKTGVLSSPDFITALGFVNADETKLRNYSSSFQIRIFEDTSIIPKLHYGLRPEVYSQLFGKYENKPLLTCFSQALRPRSRGTVKLRSKDPYESPLIDPNFLEHPNDVKDIVEGLKLCLKLAETPAMKKLGVTALHTVFPGCADYKKKELYFWCLAKQVVISMNNPVGTIKMGALSDPTTVVDSHLRVKGIKGLRVIDSSVMPMITSGNTMIPTIVVAERASDILKSTVDCDDDVAESDVQASVPMISISPDFLDTLPKILKPPAQRRIDSNTAMEQLKEVFGLYNRDKEAYHRSVTDKLQSRIKELGSVLQEPTYDRRRADSSNSVSHLIKCLEEIKQQLQQREHQKRTELPNVMYKNKVGSDLMVNQIISALNSAAQNRKASNMDVNSAYGDEIPPSLMGQLISVIEMLKEDRDVSETSSARAVAVNNQAISAEALTQILSTLNPTRDDPQPQIPIMDVVGRNTQNNQNNQNALLSQILSTLQSEVQLLPTTQSPIESPIVSSPVSTISNQTNIQDQLNQIMASINELRQGPATVQNQTDPIANDTDRTQDMMNQILSAINDMRVTTELNPSQSTTTPTTTENSQDSALNQILRTLNEIRQNDQSSRQAQVEISSSNTNSSNSNDALLSQLVSSINEMKEDIKAAKTINGQTVEDSINRQGIASLQDQNQRLLQALNQQALNQQVSSEVRNPAPLFGTLVVQQPPQQVPQQVNPILPPVIQPAMPINSQIVNPVQNLLQGQRTLQVLQTLMGRNPMQGMNQPQVLPPPMMGGPPGMVRPPFPPPPFIPPGMPQSPCQNTVVMNSINLCNGSNNPFRPLTPREIELCQSLHSAMQCQNGGNCRAIPPYLYNYYCSGK